MFVHLSALGVPHLHNCGLQCQQRDRLAAGVPALPRRCLLKHSVAVTWPGEGKPGLVLFSSDIAGFFQPFWFVFPLRFLPGCTALDTQRSRWEQPQRAGLGHLCCPGAPSEHSSALASDLFGFRSSCLGNLNSGRLHS